MYGVDNLSKILKNRNGNTSVRTSGNIDISYSVPEASAQRSNPSKMEGKLPQ
jgi:hypothetical protein